MFCEIILIGMILVFSVAVFSFSLCRNLTVPTSFHILSNCELNLIYFYIQCSNLVDLKDFRENSAYYGQKHSIITFKKSLVHFIVLTCVHLCSLVFYLCSLVFTCVPLVFHLCSLVFTCVPLVFICVHLCSLMFTCVPLVSICVHLCSTCVHLCSTCVHLCSSVFHLCSFVIICVHLCSHLCGVLDQIILL